MILEGVVTSLGPDGAVNVAPMGPRLSPPYSLEIGSAFELRPFRTSRTCANLLAHPEAVLHVTDDVLLLARAAIGDVRDAALRPAVAVRGAVLADACRAYEVRAELADGAAERVTFRAEVRHVHRLRDFFGLNRAMFAVVEAAILATRVHLLPAESIAADLDRLAVLVQKTGGPREAEAFELLRGYVRGQGSEGGG
jgi:hypothetical protein